MLCLALMAVLAAPPAIDAHGTVDAATHYERLSKRVAAAFDSARGGFVDRKGRPNESAIELALLRARDTGSSEWQARGLTSVEWLRTLRDTVGGGFHEGTREADPHSTFFDKRTISNARRLECLILAWQVSRDAAWRRDAVRVVDFFDRVLLDGRGGFVAGQVGDRELIPEANGHAIHAWMSWGAATGERRFRDFALRSGDRIWETCWAEEFGLLRRGTLGEITMLPQLIDQVEMGRAYVLAARIGGRALDRQRARRLGDLLIARFEDPEKHGFRTQTSPRKDGGVKKAARVSEENARAVLFLFELAALTGEAKYAEAGSRAWVAFTPHFEGDGLEGTDWALALRAAIHRTLPGPPSWRGMAENRTARRPASRYRTGAR
jgi:uncharacterized protein YyaL (SSP411 family)